MIPYIPKIPKKSRIQWILRKPADKNPAITKNPVYRWLEFWDSKYPYPILHPEKFWWSKNRENIFFYQTFKTDFRHKNVLSINNSFMNRTPFKIDAHKDCGIFRYRRKLKIPISKNLFFVRTELTLKMGSAFAPCPRIRFFGQSKVSKKNCEKSHFCCEYECLGVSVIRRDAAA